VTADDAAVSGVQNSSTNGLSQILAYMPSVTYLVCLALLINQTLSVVTLQLRFVMQACQQCGTSLSRLQRMRWLYSLN
jgi:hypothetical protein